MPIGRISFDLSNGSPYLRELLQRRAEFIGKEIAYLIRVPPDLSFWYFLEFGTAGRQDAAAPFKTSHSGTYAIDPLNGRYLRIPDAHVPNNPDGSRFTLHVDHPGIKPRLIYRGVRESVLARAVEGVGEAFSTTGQVRVAAIEQAMQENIMPFAVEAMGAALDRAAPGTRVDGKLTGTTAQQVWNDEATIVKVAE